MKKLLLLVAVTIFSMGQINAQDVNIPQIGVKAPSFTAETTNGKLKFPSDLGDNWKVLFSHPKDFTPVCSSEILELAYSQSDFDKLGAKIVVLSTDVLPQHESWKAALEEMRYLDREPVKIKFPLIADNDLKASELYGMIHSKENISQNIRGVYFIDPNDKIRAIYFYPNEVGRNIEEVKRTLLALQSGFENKNTVTPANWKPGGDVIVPNLSREEMDKVGKEGSEHYQYSWFLTFKKSK